MFTFWFRSLEMSSLLSLMGATSITLRSFSANSFAFFSSRLVVAIFCLFCRWFWSVKLYWLSLGYCVLAWTRSVESICYLIALLELLNSAVYSLLLFLFIQLLRLLPTLRPRRLSERLAIRAWWCLPIFEILCPADFKPLLSSLSSSNMVLDARRSSEKSPPNCLKLILCSTNDIVLFDLLPVERASYWCALRIFLSTFNLFST